MRKRSNLLLSACGFLAAAAVTVSAQAQVPRYVAPKDEVVAIRAGALYDPKSGTLLPNQVVIVRGDRIAEVGPDLPVPAGAQVIDLSSATVMPGMIDAHVHLVTGGTSPTEKSLIALAQAQNDLRAGFTTLLDMDSRYGFATVDLRDAIDIGRVQGPRLQVTGQSINYRGRTYVRDLHPDEGYLDRRTENKDVNGPWLARAAVREVKYHGADWVKIYSTQDFVGSHGLWNQDGTMTAPISLTVEEVEAIVDEAHRLGLKVACHSYSGTADDPCLIAGVDAPNHLLQLDADGIRMLREKKLPFVPTIDDLIHLEKSDLEASGGLNSRLKMLSDAVHRAKAAGIPIVFGSGATAEYIPHGKQANQFKYLVDWGLTPAEALATSFINAPKMLNYHWDRDVGTIERGKFADIIAVPGNPLADITMMERVNFVMKGGLVVRDDVNNAPAANR